jgi:toxin FitB
VAETDHRLTACARTLLDQYTTENSGNSIRDDAAMIKRTFKLKLPDAVIAATAMHLNAPLITRDNDFRQVAHLIEVRIV